VKASKARGQITASFHRSVTMKVIFSVAVLVLASSVWTSLAVGELQLLALSTFSAIYLIDGDISGINAMPLDSFVCSLIHSARD
jgi:hypothetical protein